MIATKTKLAPDFTYLQADGTSVSLSELWTASERGIVLVFLRHFGCLFCRDHVQQLRDTYPDFTRRGFDIIAVGQGTPMRAQKFAADYELPFPVLGDMELESYRLYGLTHGLGNGLLDLGAYKAALRAVLHGNLPGKPEGDTLQNPGTFLISQSGEILNVRIGTNAGDFPSGTETLGWIDELSTSPGKTEQAT